MISNSCIHNLLKLICLLQNNSFSNSIRGDCTKPFLGPNSTGRCYNTRVLSLYNKDGSLFSTSYISSSGVTLSSSIFRVISVKEDCATFLILSNSGNQYRSTNQFVNIPLHCIGAVRCLRDVIVSNL